MSTLAVITITQGHRPELLAGAVASIADQGHAANHHIITAPTIADWQRETWNAQILADYICFVDDDDVICNDSINRCVAALDANRNVGLVFTYEDLVSIDGSLLGEGYRNNITLMDVASAPTACHHLSMFRSSLVDQEVMNVCKETGAPIDWLMRAYVALKHNCIQLPFVGYKWRQDTENRISYNFNNSVNWQAARNWTRGLIGRQNLFKLVDVAAIN
jgi:hypothetical protein